MKTRSHRIDYKKELEIASKGMIMIHDPKLLIKLIVRIIVSKVQIQHAGIILYEPERDSYVLNISRGETGIKIPAGFARFDKDHPVIKLFTNKEYKAVVLNKNALLSQDISRLIWQESVLEGGRQELKDILHKVGDQMKMFNAVACVPAYFQERLLAILLLGEKNDHLKFDQDELNFFEALASDVAMAIRNAQLFESLKKESDKNHDLFIRTTIALGSAIEAKDKYTSGHTERVTNYSVAIARQMVAAGVLEFSDSFFENLYIGAMLHDIGKIGIPEAILNKTGPLQPDEVEIMRMHTMHGVEILKPLSELKESLAGVKYHHERFDGKGYPEGLKDDEIPIIATIIAVADAYDAMTTNRPYRSSMSREEALQIIKENIGTQFSPNPAKALVSLIEKKKI